MSFGIFRQNMLSYMSNQRAISSYQDFAKRLTLEYDGTIRRGYQSINKVSVLKTNVKLMENILNFALLTALQKQKGLHDIINQIGQAVEGYWIGTTLNNFPIPIIPAVGAFMNIQTVTASVSKPGVFPDMKLQYPTDNIESFLDMLILGMKSHLFTIEGTYSTISLYPGFPAVPPLPGVVQWVGYEVPDTPPSAPKPDVPDTDTSDTVSNEVQDAILLDTEQETIANAATDNGYNVVESTGAGLLKSQNIEPKVAADGLGEHPIEQSTTNESETRPNDETISNCESGQIVPPPANLISAMRKWGIREPLERAHFLAQCAHESGNFYYKREIWGPTSAQLRYDTHKYLGNESPGDGRKYLGRGYIQLTGKANYKQFNKGVPDDVVRNPDLVETKYPGDTACWFWKTRKINLLAIDDTIGTIKLVTKRINGGQNGLDDRVKKFCGYWEQIKNNPDLYA